MAGITIDTNILVRIAVNDDPTQSRTARDILGKADHVAVPTIALCEFVWVLSNSYKLPSKDIATTIRHLTEVGSVHVDRLAVSAGLAMLDAGGDFADGVIAHEGALLGGETFVSFDRKAVARFSALGVNARRAD